MRPRQRDGVKLAGQCTPSSKEASRTREGKAYLRAWRGRGLGWAVLVNLCESLINPVIENKPNMLTGLGQKASGWTAGCKLQPQGLLYPPGERRDLTRSCCLRGTRQTRPFAGNGKPTARKADGGRAWDGGKSESRPVMGRTGIAPQGNIIPTGNGADFRRVSRHERVCGTFLRGTGK
jgi:hypothetical protein